MKVCDQLKIFCDIKMLVFVGVSNSKKFTGISIGKYSSRLVISLEHSEIKSISPF